MAIPFRALAADLATGEEVVIDHGELSRGIRASMSIPGVFPPVEDGERLLVDGGVLNNLPRRGRSGPWGTLVALPRALTDPWGRLTNTRWELINSWRELTN